MPKPKSCEHGENEFLLYPIIGFSKFYLYESKILAKNMGPFHSLPNNEDIIQNVSSPYEASLFMSKK